MERRLLYIVTAEGEETLAEILAAPLSDAGYDVRHDGTVTVGESMVAEPAKVLGSGAPIVLCATKKSAGSEWSHQIVNAGHAGGAARVFVVLMEKGTYIGQLALKAKVARYCDDPDGAVQELLDALAKHFPPDDTAVHLQQSNGYPFLEQQSEAATFDFAALHRFRGQLRDEVTAQYPPSLTAWEFLDRAGLRVDGLLTRTGALLFCRDSLLPGASNQVKCVRYYGVDRSARRTSVTIDGDVPGQIVAARKFVAEHVSRGEEPSVDQAQSAVVYSYPMIAVREIIANAMVHRDYSVTESCVHVRLFDDRLEVSSPGAWIGHELPDGGECSLTQLNGQSIKRNFRLAHVLSWIRLVEGEGSGIPSALRDCETMAALPPTVVQDQGFVTVSMRPRLREGNRTPPTMPLIPGIRHRTVVALDIDSSAKRTSAERGKLRASLYDLVEQALLASGIVAAYRDPMIDRGDGVLILIHPVDKIPKTLILNTFVPTLAERLSLHAQTNPTDQLTLRMVVHAGEVMNDSKGWFGETLDIAFGLLSAPVIRMAAAASAQKLNIVVSDFIYSSIVRHGHEGIDAKNYRPDIYINIDGQRHRGWVHSPVDGIGV